MKTLYLIRHAKSSWRYKKLSDFERPLNERGRKAAPLMGKILKKKGVLPHLIISSPATRAIFTARLIAEKLKYPLNDIVTVSALYDAKPRVILGTINQLDDSFEEVMLIGHDTGITDLANDLTDQTILKFPTCAVFSAKFDIHSWNEIKLGSGQFYFFEYPNMYKSTKKL